jgi:hypothetical protein
VLFADGHTADDQRGGRTPVFYQADIAISFGQHDVDLAMPLLDEIGLPKGQMACAPSQTVRLSR